MNITRDSILAIIWLVAILGGLGFAGGLEAKWAAEDQARIVQAQAGR